MPAWRNSEIGLATACILTVAAIVLARRAGLIDAEAAAAIATVFGGLLASFYGAKKAMEFQETKERANTVSREVDAVNAVLLTMIRRLESLENLNEQVVAPVRYHPSRHLDMQRIVHGLELWPLNLETLSPLLKHERAANILSELSRTDRDFHTIRAIMAERDNLYRELAELTSAAGLRMEHEVTGDAIRNMVGERVWFGLIGITDHLVSELDAARPRLRTAIGSLSAVASEIYKGQPILKAVFPEPSAVAMPGSQ